MTTRLLLALCLATTALYGAGRVGYVQYYDDLDHLLAGPKGISDVASVRDRGDATTDDGALYYYDATAADATNTTTIFAPSYGGRWFRSISSDSTSADLTVADDLFVGGDAWVTNDLTVVGEASMLRGQTTTTFDVGTALTASTVRDATGDLRTGPGGLTSKMDYDETTATITEGARTWLELQSFDQAHFNRAPTSEITNYTGTTFAFDLDGPRRAEWSIPADATLSLLNTGSVTGPLALPYKINMYGDSLTNCLLVLDEIITQGTQRAPVYIKAGEFLTGWLDYNGTNWIMDWRGDQSDPGPIELGFTGNTRGVAQSPTWNAFVPYIYAATGSNTFDINHARGTSMHVNSETNTYFRDVSDVPTDDGEKEMIVRLWNTNSVGPSTWQLDFNPSWILWGFDDPHLVTNETYELFMVRASTNGVYVDNMHPRGFTGGGGGSPPASALFDDILANWKFEEIAGTTVDNAEGTAALDLAEFNGVWTKNVAGINNLAWTNTTTSRVLTNDAAGLELGRSGASFSVAGWIWMSATPNTHLCGEANTPSDYAWLMRTSPSGYLQGYASTTGGSPTSFTSSFLLTTGSRHLVSFVFDNANNVIKVSMDGQPYQATPLVGDLFDAVAPFSVGGAFLSGSAWSPRMQVDEFTVWDAALTDALISEHYASGVGSFYTP